ncbi:MAG: NiFeSe hydrogenase large subunit HysA [Desulfoplanes sp.]
MSGCKPNKAPVAGASSKKIKIAVDPVTRIEGHLKVEVEVKNGKVIDAKCIGGMYRGFENILVGRDPRDASQLTQRICGVCPTAHATASVLALDDAFGVKVSTNGRIARNLILGANFLQSHILHFYHLAALDYVKGPDTAPFIPRYENADLLTDRIKDPTKAAAVNTYGLDQYLKALEIRRVCHEMVALLGGKMPHVQGLVAGGTTEAPSQEKIAKYYARFKDVSKFIVDEYLPLIYTLGSVYPDMFEIGAGYKNCVAWGVFPLSDDNPLDLLLKRGAYIDGKDVVVDPKLIKEYVGHSWFNQSKSGLNFAEGETIPDVHKADAYSFIKASRYNDKACEVGPLARMWVQNAEFSPVGKKMLKDLYKIDATHIRDLGDKAFSIMGRHVARAEEAYLVANAIEGWLKEIKPGESTYTPYKMAETAQGLGMTEAPRGALLHYIDVKDTKISNYQIVSATLWNANPMDDMGQRGPIEECLIGIPVPDVKNPVNVGRLIRAFDP